MGGSRLDVNLNVHRPGSILSSVLKLWSNFSWIFWRPHFLGRFWRSFFWLLFSHDFGHDFCTVFSSFFHVLGLQSGRNSDFSGFGIPIPKFMQSRDTSGNSGL